MNNNWSAEDHELLAKLHKDGLTATQIAARLPGQRTKNSVIGRIHRKIQGKPSHRTVPSKPKPPIGTVEKRHGRPWVKHLKPSAPKPARPHTGKPSAPSLLTGGGLLPATRPRKAVYKPTIGAPIPFMELRDSLCKFAVTEGSPFMFCGAPVHGENSWCEYHCSIVFNGFANCCRLSRGSVRSLGCAGIVHLGNGRTADYREEMKRAPQEVPFE